MPVSNQVNTYRLKMRSLCQAMAVKSGKWFGYQAIQ